MVYVYFHMVTKIQNAIYKKKEILNLNLVFRYLCSLLLYINLK